MPSADGAKALARGEIDAAIFLATPDTEFIQQMLYDGNLRLMNMEHAVAYSKRLPFLHHLVLAQGAIDIQRNIPAQDVHLVGPTAQLVVRDDLHPALKYLLLKAASETHHEPGLFNRKNQFPADKDIDFPLSEEAQHYFKSGPPFLQRYLPFWLATLIDRMIVVTAPKLLGDPVAPGLLGESGAASDQMADARALTAWSCERIGDDLWIDAWLREPD